MTPHSPLPPPQAVTLDSVAIKMDHLITVVEVMVRRVERIDDKHEQTLRLEKSMREIALRLASAGIAMATARVVAAVAAPSRILVVTAAGAFAGGLVGTFIWQALHIARAPALP